VRDAVAGKTPRVKTPIVSVPGWALPPLTAVIGLALRDRILTRDEYHAMADDLADSDAPSSGQTSFTDWLSSTADGLGRHYINDTRRPFQPAESTRTQL
jgi:hypothetical protein